MPYTIVENDGQYCVHIENEDGSVGASEGCHDTLEEAQAHMAALYANVEDATMDKTIRRAKGQAVKAVGDNRVAGHLVVFTNSSDRDLYGEYFNKATNFWMEMGYPIKGAPILLEHGFDSMTKVMPVGIFDLATIDDIGIYVEGKLKDRDEYEAMLTEMRNKGMISATDEEIAQKATLAVQAVKAVVSTDKTGWSSGALPQGVDVDRYGHITSWPIIEGTITFTPAEPDGTEIRLLTKAFKELEATLDSIQTPDTATVGGGATHIELDATGDVEPGETPVDETTNEDEDQPSEVTTMTVEELLAALQEWINQAAADMGMGEEEAANATASVTDDVKSEVESMTDEERAALNPEALAEKVFAKVLEYQGKIDATRKAFNDKREAWKKSQPPVDSKLPGVNKGADKPRIQVGELRKYEHLSAEEMTLAYKLLKQAYPEAMRRRVNAKAMIEDGLINEAFFVSMAHKSVATSESLKPKSDHLSMLEYSAVKAAFPFKADELMASDITNQGDEWPSVFYDNMLWTRAREQTALFDLLQSRGMVMLDVPQGAESVNVKLETSQPSVYTRSQANNTDTTGRPEVTAQIQPFGTDQITVTPAEHVIATSTTDILTEDSIINIVQYMNQDMTRTLAESLESAMLNGDTTTTASSNINLIDGTPATGLQKPDYLAWDGFRHHVLVDHTGQGNDASGAALVITDFFDTVAEFADNAIESRTNELVFVVDAYTHRKARQLPELLTPGVAGVGASIYVGDLPNIDGIPIYRSGFLALSNSAGKIPAAGGTLGQILCIYPYYWAYARKRAVTIETDRFVLSGSTVFVASVRHLLQARSANAATMTYNIAIT